MQQTPTSQRKAQRVTESNQSIDCLTEGSAGAGAGPGLTHPNCSQQGRPATWACRPMASTPLHLTPSNSHTLGEAACALTLRTSRGQATADDSLSHCCHVLCTSEQCQHQQAGAGAHSRCCEPAAGHRQGVPPQPAVPSHQQVSLITRPKPNQTKPLTSKASAATSMQGVLAAASQH